MEFHNWTSSHSSSHDFPYIWILLSSYDHETPCHDVLVPPPVLRGHDVTLRQGGWNGGRVPVRASDPQGPQPSVLPREAAGGARGERPPPAGVNSLPVCPHRPTCPTHSFRGAGGRSQTSRAVTTLPVFRDPAAPLRVCGAVYVPGPGSRWNCMCFTYTM